MDRHIKRNRIKTKKEELYSYAKMDNEEAGFLIRAVNKISKRFDADSRVLNSVEYDLEILKPKSKIPETGSA